MVVQEGECRLERKPGTGKIAETPAGQAEPVRCLGGRPFFLTLHREPVRLLEEYGGLIFSSSQERGLGLGQHERSPPVITVIDQVKCRSIEIECLVASITLERRFRRPYRILNATLRIPSMHEVVRELGESGSSAVVRGAL